MRWYVFAIIFMAVVKIVVLLVNRVITGEWLPIDYVALAGIIPAIAISTPVQSGEEIGWRGYALPRLGERIGFAWASLLLGLIWGLWHVPLFFVRGGNQFGQSIPLFVLGTVSLSVAITWLYTHTGGSLLLTMLMHSAINQTTEVIHDRLPSPGNPSSFRGPLSLFLTVAFLWIPAVFFLLRMKNTGFRHKDSCEQRRCT
jgi:membrane protease YdiL (CAAX protease family)